MSDQEKPTGGQVPPKGPKEKQVKGPDGLTPKQRLFVEHYVATKNATQAAELAGYKGNRATLGAVGGENLQKPEIADAISKAIHAEVKEIHFTQNEVLGWLNEIRIRCMQHEAVLDRQGNPTGEYKFDANGAIKASELIGRHTGLWKEKDATGSTDSKRSFSDDLGRLRQSIMRIRKK